MKTILLINTKSIHFWRHGLKMIWVEFGEIWTDILGGVWNVLQHKSRRQTGRLANVRIIDVLGMIQSICQEKLNENRQNYSKVINIYWNLIIILRAWYKRHIPNFVTICKSIHKIDLLCFYKIKNGQHPKMANHSEVINKISCF